MTGAKDDDEPEETYITFMALDRPHEAKDLTNLWVVDSGTGGHSTNQPGLLHDPLPMRKEITVANGGVMTTDGVGKVMVRGPRLRG